MAYMPLSWSIDPKIVGVRDGLGPCFLNADFYERHPWYRNLFIRNDSWTEDWWQPQATMPDYGGPLLRIPMERLARHTDFIDFGNFRRGYLVNDKLRRILEKALLPRHRYFPATFMHGKQEVTGYWWLCYDLEVGRDHVEFARSEFDSFDSNPLSLTPKPPLFFAGYADYMQAFREKGRAAIATKLHFKPSFNGELDLWGVQFLSTQKGYISDRLLAEFKRHGITGYGLRKPTCALVLT